MATLGWYPPVRAYILSGNIQDIFPVQKQYVKRPVRVKPDVRVFCSGIFFGKTDLPPKLTVHQIDLDGDFAAFVAVRTTQY